MVVPDWFSVLMMMVASTAVDNSLYTRGVLNSSATGSSNTILVTLGPPWQPIDQWEILGRSRIGSRHFAFHYNDVIMDAMASEITRLTTVFSTVYLDTDQRKHQSSASLAFVREIHRRPANSPHKWPVTRKTFPFDDIIMSLRREKSMKWLKNWRVIS